MMLAAGIAAGCAGWLTEHPGRVWIAAAVATALVFANIGIRHFNARAGTMAAFSLMALAAATLGIGWTLGMIGT
jgi:hypothetical protein